MMNLDLTQVILAIITAISGGSLVAFFNYKLSNRKTDSDQFSLLILEYKEMRINDTKTISNLELRISNFQVRVDQLENKHHQNLIEIQKLQNQLLMFEGSHSDIPLPTWLKDTSGKMLYLNSEYERFFLIPIGKSTDDYVGKTDKDIWDEITTKTFEKHDNQVMRFKKPERFIEEVELNGVKYYLDVLKYPRKLKNKVIGIGGIVLRKSTKLLWIDETEKLL